MSSEKFRRVLVSALVVGLVLSFGGPANENSMYRHGFNSDGYLLPRFPKFVETPAAGQLLAGARMAVRQTYGMAMLGLAEPGHTVHVLLGDQQDIEVREAIRTAWEEREVTAVAIQPWELHGVTEAEYRAKLSIELAFGNEGWNEIGNFYPV